MSNDGNMVYLGLCVRYQPPIIGIHYKNKASDQKKKVYTILLQKLVLHPNPEQAARQLYLEHPQILKKDKIPVIKIAQLISKIQKQLHIGEQQYDENDEDEQQYQMEEQQPKREQRKLPKYNFAMNDYDDGPLNKSL